MDHISQTLAQATSEDITTATRITPLFAALSGLQSWSCASSNDAHPLALFNVISQRLNPHRPTSKTASPYWVHVSVLSTDIKDIERAAEKAKAWAGKPARIMFVHPSSGLHGTSLRGLVRQLKNLD